MNITFFVGAQPLDLDVSDWIPHSAVGFCFLSSLLSVEPAVPIPFSTELERNSSLLRDMDGREREERVRFQRLDPLSRIMKKSLNASLYSRPGRENSEI